jgi:hypothetical protein
MLDAIYFHMERARGVDREILELSSFVSSDVIKLITLIENDVGCQVKGTTSGLVLP